MGYDVSALQDYTKQNSAELVSAVVSGYKTARVIEIQPGIKSTADINIMDTDVKFQNDTCSFDADGTTSFKKRVITVGQIKVQEKLCPKDLNSKYLQLEMPMGSADDTVPFEKQYADLKIAKISAQNEIALWRGDTASADANLNKFDGFLKVIDAETDVIDGNLSSATSITSTNVIGLMNDMYRSIPSKLLSKENLTIMVGEDVFRTYTLALITANLFHYDGKSSDMEIVLPGTNTKIMALPGLNETNRMIAAVIGDNGEGNLVMGTDLAGEEDTFKMWYSKDNRAVLFSTNYKLGAQVKIPSEIVEFTLSA